MKNGLAVALATLASVALAGCDAAASSGGTIERCAARAHVLTIGGEPLTLSIEASRTSGSCDRGDLEADVVAQLVATAGVGELLVRAVPEDPSEDLVIVIQNACGDASSTRSCADHAPGASGAEQLVVRERLGVPVFVRVRTRSGRPARVTLSAHERPLHSDGESCDPAGATPGCAEDPECVAENRCDAGRTCSDGTCVAAIVGEGARCGGAITCTGGRVCVDERCVRAVGAPCDAPPTYCSARFGLVCVDETCRGVTARTGERCNRTGPPTCQRPLECEGEPGAEVCVDTLGLVCSETATIAAARRPGPAPVVTAVSIDAGDPSMHASGCGIGAGVPDRSFRITGVLGVLHAIARSTDGGPAPFLYARGPVACAESTHTCGELGDHVGDLWGGGSDLFLVVEGAGSHELEIYDAEQILPGGVCDDADPYRVCQAGTECVDGRCAGEVPTLVPGPCFCRPGGIASPGDRARVRGGLAPGGEGWFAIFPGATLAIAPRDGICPADLAVELFDGDVPCGECDPAVLTTVASARIGDGSACAPVELTFPAGSPRSLRMVLRSELGGAYDLDVSLSP